MSEKRKRSELSIMTGFLCCFVVMIHLTSAPVGELSVGSIQHTCIYAINKALSFVVPAFLFLSGLKLTYSYRDKPFVFSGFFTKRFTKILTPYVFWYAAYYVLFRWLGYMEPKTVGEHIFSFLMGDLVSPFYFITIVFQFYGLFGCILWLFRHVRHSLILVAVALAEFWYLEYTYIPYEDRFFVTYMIYFMLGCFCAYHLDTLQRMLQKCWIVVYMAYFALTAWHIYHGYQSAYLGLPYSHWRVATCLFALSAIFAYYHFSLFLSKGLPKLYMTVFLWLDKASYGVFLCHSFLIYIYNGIWSIMGIRSIAQRFFLNTALVYPMAILGVIGFLWAKNKCKQLFWQPEKYE